MSVNAYFLKYIIATGVSGSVAAVCVLALLPVIKRVFACAWLYGLLTVSIALFLFPFSFAMIGFARVGSVDAENIRYSTYIVSDVPADIENTAASGAFDYTVFVWAGGFIVFMANKAREYAIFYNRTLKHNRPLYDESLIALFDRAKTELKIKKPLRLFINPNISSPMIVCMFKPAVLMPDITLSDAQWRLVFLHELTHYKRRDLWFLRFAMIANAVHWFNPFAYVIYSNIRAACEFSCDEAVLKIAGPHERKQYGMTILNMLDHYRSANKNAFTSAMSGSRKRIEQRLKLIMRDNLSRGGFVLPVAVIALVAYLSLLPAAVSSVTVSTQSAVVVTTTVITATTAPEEVMPET